MEGIKKSLYIFAYQLEPSIEIWQFKNIFLFFPKFLIFFFQKSLNLQQKAVSKFS